MKNFKSQKLIIALKDHKAMFFEKNLTKTDLSMHGLVAANQISKVVKFEKIKIEVFVRIR